MGRDEPLLPQLLSRPRACIRIAARLLVRGRGVRIQRIVARHKLHDKFSIALLHHMSAGRFRWLRKFCSEIVNRQPVICQQTWLCADEQFRMKSANAGDFCNAFERPKLGSNQGVLDRPQFSKVVARSFDGVPVNLSGGNAIGGKIRSDSRRQSQVQRRDSLLHALPCRRVRHIVVKYNVQHRVTHVARPAHNSHIFEPLKLLRQWLSDLFVNLGWPMSLPLREDDDLVFGQVRHSVHRCVQRRIDPRDGEDDGRQQHDAAVLNGAANDPFNHRRVPASVAGSGLWKAVLRPEPI